MWFPLFPLSSGDDPLTGNTLAQPFAQPFAKPFGETRVKGDTVVLRYRVRDAQMALDERHTTTTVRCAHCGALVDRHLYVTITGVLTIDGLGDTPLDERLRVCVDCYSHMRARARHSPLWRDLPTTDVTGNDDGSH